MEHGQDCNCEDCWWSRGQREICPTCGCVVGEGCPCSDVDVEEYDESVDSEESK